MSFHGPLEPEGEPIRVYWTPVDRVEESDANEYLLVALAGRSDRQAFVFLQSGVFDTDDAAPIGYFDAALNGVTGEVCGFHMPYNLSEPIWTVTTPGDYEGAIQQIHDRLVERGHLAGPAGE